MGHAHVHARSEDAEGDDVEAGARVSWHVRRVVWAAVAVCGVLTLLGLVVLWPGSQTTSEDPLGLDADPVSATVTVVDDVPCSYAPQEQCRLVAFDITSGPERGTAAAMELGTDSRISEGDGIYVLSYETVDGGVEYVFYEFQRRTPMLLLLILFVAAVLVLGRWRGLGALAGLVVSLAVIIVFALPSLLDGNDAVAVALVTASVIAFCALFLAHGFGVTTAVALVSTLLSLAVTAALGWIFVVATHLTGMSDESSYVLAVSGGAIDVRGLVLAGLVIGSLGVLDDVTVTQVSAVWELKRLDPSLPTREVVSASLRIGRDHISSTVNTLFLAYAGASLPLLLLFTQASQSLGSVLTREIVATEFVRALVGSIGLVASVPIASWLAALALASHRGLDPEKRSPAGHA
jgi:uncharacterized membrane protein